MVVFDPPITVPVAIGDALLDLPVSGASDTPRDVTIRLRTDDGGAMELFGGTAFGAVTCVRGNGVALAYAAGTGALVSVRGDGAGGWLVRESMMADIQFDPLSIDHHIARRRDATSTVTVGASAVSALAGRPRTTRSKRSMIASGKKRLRGA